MDAGLPFHERLAVEFHLVMCRYCARYRKQLKQLRAASSQIDTELPGCEPSENLSEECKDRIKAALLSL